MKTYSCDECKNRGMTSRCKRCIHTADKKPTKFKLDKNAVPCPAYSNDNKECNLIVSIRVWKEEIEKIDLEIKAQELIDVKPVMDFFYACNHIIPSRFFASTTCYDNEHLLNVIGGSFHVVSASQLISTLQAIREREATLIELRRKRDEVNQKIEDAKKKLGI